MEGVLLDLGISWRAHLLVFQRDLLPRPSSEIMERKDNTLSRMYSNAIDIYSGKNLYRERPKKEYAKSVEQMDTIYQRAL